MTVTYRMAYLYKDSDSSFWNFRTRTPSDILGRLDTDRMLLVFERCMGSPGFQANVRIGGEVKFSLRTRNDAVAEIRKNVALTELSKVWAAARFEPKRLTHIQILGLARLVHELYVESFEQEPGERADWIAHKALNRAVEEGRLINVPAIVPRQIPDEREFAARQFGEDLTAGVNSLPVLPDREKGLENRFGLLCNWVLTQNGLRVDYATRSRLLAAIAKAADTGPRRLKDNADGNYGVDTRLEKYPTFRAARTMTQAFEDWKREAQPAPSTVSTWQGHLNSLRSFVAHEEVERLTQQDIVSWKDHLVQKGMAAKTINDGYLACVKRLLNYEKDNGRLRENVAEAVSVFTRARAGQRRLPYTTDEVAKLLMLAREAKHPNQRWLPWLVALSGSRVGEVAQLWGCGIKTVGSVHVMTITPAPDGGRLKNHQSERETPVHPAIIKEGFLDFVAHRGQGPLIYNRTSGDPAKKHASKSVANRLAAWVRQQPGYQDPRKDPNHAFRHWFKTELSSLQVPDSLADAIMGHAERSEADGYRHHWLQTKADAISRVKAPPAWPS